MTDLTHTQLTELKDNIEDALETHSIAIHPSEPRTHLGISEIGEDCKRKLYYKFRWVAFEHFDGRMRRLFARGHREEERFINYLEGIGCKVNRFDKDGKQFRVSGVMGHYGGSCDGVVYTPWYTDLPFLLEMKTHNIKSFVEYVSKGLQISKPMHLDQMNGYGQKMQIQYGLYFPENKNDDDIKVTPIKLDWERGKALEKKAEEIITAQEPPPKISDNPAFWKCGYCFAKDVCHYGALPIKNCRSCKNVKAADGAQWKCSKFGIVPESFVIKGCDQWIPI
jgi:CRISPR/Cas system-associated exonuclease Cas4 (RecB family)